MALNFDYAVTCGLADRFFAGETALPVPAGLPDAKTARLASRAYPADLPEGGRPLDRPVSLSFRIGRVCSPMSNTALLGLAVPLGETDVGTVRLNGVGALRFREASPEDWGLSGRGIVRLYRVEFPLWTARIGDNELTLDCAAGSNRLVFAALFLDENRYPVVDEQRKRMELRAEYGIRGVMDLQEKVVGLVERREGDLNRRILSLVREDGYRVAVEEFYPDDIMPSTRPALFVSHKTGAALAEDVAFVMYCEDFGRSVVVVRPRPDDGSRAALVAGAEDVIVAGRYACHRWLGRSVMLYFDDDVKRVAKFAMDAEWSVMYSPAPEDLLPPVR